MLIYAAWADSYRFTNNRDRGVQGVARNAGGPTFLYAFTMETGWIWGNLNVTGGERRSGGRKGKNSRVLLSSF